MGKTTECKRCSRPISFEKAGSKWIPTDPETGERHVCIVEVKCQECGVIFEGEPWKKLCSVCWDTEHLDKNRVNRGRGGDSKDARKPERVKRGSHDNKLPF